MAETLTYDPATDTATVGDNLTPEEQENLEVGEKLEAEQEGLLAGKYKNAEELEKAYQELEKKLGVDEPENTTTETEQDTKPEAEVNPNIELITNASAEYADKGELSEDTYSKFAELSSKELVKAYVEGIPQFLEGQAQRDQQAKDLTESEVNTIQNSVGGEKAYADVLTWGTQNLPPDTMQAFDTLIGSGNAKAIELAVAGLKAQYDNDNGYEGRMLSGKAPSSSGDVFRSQPELVAAMNDPRYDSDPAYRQDVIAKLERSDNLQF